MTSGAQERPPGGGAQAAVVRLLRPGAIQAVYQPIVRLADSAIIGYEGLARMPDTGFGPEECLDLAESMGLREQIEVACAHAVAANGLPPADRLLFVNASPATLGAAGLEDALATIGPRLVLELTERQRIASYDEINDLLAPWIASGARLAVDDAGSGYASLEHVVKLRPDFLKLASSLVSGVDQDRHRQAVLRAVVAFAREVGSVVVAEGVERYEELRTLVDADVDYVQGYLLARPGPPWPVLRRQASRSDDQWRQRSEVANRVRGLDAATDETSACDLVVDHLFRRGVLLPSVYLVRGGRLRCISQRGYWQVIDGVPPSAGILGRTYRTGERQIIGDVREHDEFLEAIPGVASEICVPLRIGTAMIGALNVESPTALAADVVDEVDRCAEMLSARLSEIGLRAETRPQRLAQHGVALARLTSTEDVLDRLLDAACDIAEMGSAMVALGPPGELTVRAARGSLAPVFADLEPAMLQTLSGWVESIMSVYTSGSATGTGFIGHESLRRGGVASLVVLPIPAGPEGRGVLVIADPNTVTLGTEDVELLELLAAQAGSALQTAHALHELADRAARDPLTGLGHHASFHAALQQTRSRSPHAGNGAVAVLFLDVDGFKQVNDSEGHAAGDQLLCLIAATLHAALRRDDVLFRVGGDEFAAVLRVDGPQEAVDIGHRLCAAARAIERTVSIGVALARPGDTDAMVIAHADQALYGVKRAGRDDVRLWSPLAVVPGPRQAAEHPRRATSR